MLTRAVAVMGLVLASAVVVVSTGSPASAAVPCTQTFRSSGGTQQFLTVYVPPHGTWLTPEARVTDVDVRVIGQSSGSSTGPLTITLEHDRFSELYRSQSQATDYYPSWDLTFDDEAGSRPGYGQTVGRVVPTHPLSIHDLGPASGVWRVAFEQPGGSFDPREVELTITSDDCDSDGDGVPQYVDNCPMVANADQTDWDGDRVGNACDATPGTAPAPPPTTTPTPTTTPPPATGTPSSTCSAGCAYVSTVGLRHRVRKHRLVGTVDSAALGCRAGIEVTVWRKRSGDDRKLVVVTSKPTGKFRTRAPRRAGRYYATVGTPDQPLCGAATSRVVRIKRR